MIRAKAKWLKDAEKNTKYFFNLEKRNYINKTIQQLINDKGDTITAAGSPSVPGDLPFLNVLIAETHSSFEIIPSQFNISSSLSFGISGSSGKKKLLISLMLS
jgi:hypothetical protein